MEALYLVALALEEMGFKRAGSAPSLFKTPPTKYIDSNTYLPKEQNNNNTFRILHHM